jgi:hypothetical protein
MDNFLSNGTVLPSGLLSGSSSSMMDGFKKTYQNSYLRVGVVVKTYNIGSPENVSTDNVEYDVLAWQQNEGGSATAITYKHCTASTSFGSIADFFEAKLRQIESKTTAGITPTPYGQDGAIVLLLCLNGFSDTAIIIASLSNPQRQSTLVGSDLHLEGEYNGVNIKVNSDGSTSLVFNGATDSYGVPTDSSQGVTTAQIATDGSFSVQHSGASFVMAKSGVVTITSTGNTVINAQGDSVVNTQGKATITSTGKTSITASEIDLNGTQGEVLTTFTDPVVDTIFGDPTVGVPTVLAGS